MRTLGGGLGFADGGLVAPIKKADGGLIRGPGTATSDSIPALLSDGEFVVKASAVGRHRQLLEAINDHKVPKVADGGLVGGGSPGSIGGGNSHTMIAPAINVTVQGQPGATQADHARMGAEIAKAAGAHISALIGQEIRTQTRPGGLLHR
jgi:hypothetical protein